MSRLREAMDSRSELQAVYTYASICFWVGYALGICTGILLAMSIVVKLLEAR